jgi:hypothetical protein
MAVREKRFVAGLDRMRKSGAPGLFAGLRNQMHVPDEGVHGLSSHETLVCLFMKGSEKRSGGQAL